MQKLKKTKPADKKEKTEEKKLKEIKAKEPSGENNDFSSKFAFEESSAKAEPFIRKKPEQKTQNLERELEPTDVKKRDKEDSEKKFYSDDSRKIYSHESLGNNSYSSREWSEEQAQQEIRETIKPITRQRHKQPEVSIRGEMAEMQNMRVSREGIKYELKQEEKEETPWSIPEFQKKYKRKKF